MENTLPEAVLRGYFNGKRRAEQALLSAYPENGVVLKPGFMYGTRHIDVNGREVQIPLGLVGKPLEMLLSLPGISNLKNIPGMRAVLARPLDVNTVGRVAADIAINGSKQSILSEDDIANF